MANTEVSEDLGLLIEIVQNYPYLYDLSHPDYKNIRRKEDAWEEISQIVNFRVEDCKRYWKNLRDRFLREKRDKPSGSGAPDTKWVYFDKMSFYAKYSKPRKTSTNILRTEAESRPGSSCSPVASSIWSSIDIVSPSPQHSDDGMESTAEAPAATPTTSKEPSERGSKRKRGADSADLSEMVNTAKKLASTLELRSGPPNSNRTFVEYLYSRLEEMTPAEAKEKRKQVLLVLEGIE